MKEKGLQNFIRVFKRFASLNNKSGVTFFLVIFLIILSNICNALNIYFIGKVIDYITIDRIDLLIDTVIIMFVLQIIKLPIVYFSNRQANYLSETCIKRTREYTYNHILKANIKWIDNTRIGDLLSRVNGDLNRLANGISTILTWQMADLLQCTIAIVICFVLNWKLSLICFASFPILIFIKTRLVAPVARYSEKRAVSEGSLSAMFVDLMGGMPIVKAFGIEEQINKKYDSELEKCVIANEQASKVEFAVFPIQLLVMLLPRVLVMAVGCYFVIHSNFTLGAYITFILVSNNAIDPIGLLAWEIREAFEVAGVASRLMDIWDAEEENEGGSVVSPTNDMSISFQNVEFSYNSEEKVLENVSFVVQPGEHVALVGESGSGKTTIFRLLTGFFEKTKGTIKIFGTEIENWDKKALRELLSYVGQDMFLFPESILDNVKLGNPNVAEDEVLKVIKMSGLDNLDISAEIGEDGVKLSGGQKQRVCIARAMLKNASFVLFDEPTSALDTESEMRISKMSELMLEGKTCISIAHRLSTIQHVDKILVLDKGKIAETGTHEQLMNKKGIYYNLYNKQEKEDNKNASI